MERNVNGGTKNGENIMHPTTPVGISETNNGWKTREIGPRSYLGKGKYRNNIITQPRSHV
jgi:hypothetical protein